jgi:hypothetical protein
MTKKAPANAIKWQINTSKKAKKNVRESLACPNQMPIISDQPSTSHLLESSTTVQFQFGVN